MARAAAKSRDPAVAPNYAALGKLTTLGPTQPWQVALLLPLPFSDPANFQDMRRVHEDVRDAPVGVPSAFLLEVAAPAEVRFGPPRLAIKFADASGALYPAIAFGDIAALKAQVPRGKRVLVVGKYLPGNDRHATGFLQVDEVVPAAWAGRIRPKYPGNGKVIGAATVRERVFKLLRGAIAEASAYLETLIDMLGQEPQVLLDALGAQGADAATLLRNAHLPHDLADGQRAHVVLESLAALIALHKAHANRPTIPVKRRLRLSSLDQCMARSPHRMTDEQVQAVKALAHELEGPHAARCVLSADVGFGKSIVYQSVLGSALKAGARALVLLPNYPMAAQAHQEFAAMFPDLPALLVTSDTDTKTDLDAHPLVIGTTALLFRNAGRRDLVIVDEQQRFDVRQRETYVRGDAHLIEISATCIPRTQALIAFGAVRLVQLTKPHTPKHVTTRFWPVDQKRELFKAIRQTVQDGGKALIVYPVRGEDGKSIEEQGHRNVAAAAQLWERMFPGRVRSLTGADTNEVKRDVLADFAQGRADILVSTSLIEVGINVRNLRRLAVIDAEAFGLSQLHQFRGRLAREGGAGSFDIYCSREPPESAMQRFDVLCRVSDGFAIAEADMRRRGFGDLAPGAKNQTGADISILYGRPISIEAVEAVEPIFRRLSADRRQR